MDNVVCKCQQHTSDTFKFLFYFLAHTLEKWKKLSFDIYFLHIKLVECGFQLNYPEDDTFQNWEKKKIPLKCGRDVKVESQPLFSFCQKWKANSDGNGTFFLQPLVSQGWPKTPSHCILLCPLL